MELTIEMLNSHLATFSSKDKLEIAESQFGDNYVIYLSMNGTILKRKTCVLENGAMVSDEDIIKQTRENFLLTLFLDGIITPAVPLHKPDDKKLDISQKLTLLNTLTILRQNQDSEGTFNKMITNNISELIKDLMLNV